MRRLIHEIDMLINALKLQKLVNIITAIKFIFYPIKSIIFCIFFFLFYFIIW